jgi:ribosomal protein L22
MSAQKMREVVRQIQGLPALQALEQVLAVVPRKGARSSPRRCSRPSPTRKTTTSLQPGDPARSRKRVAGTATTLKRFQPKARGSAGPILKRRCHIKIVLCPTNKRMGQKTNPIGLRIAVNKDWRSKWYADKKDFGRLLNEDRQIRDLLKEARSRPRCRGF